MRLRSKSFALSLCALAAAVGCTSNAPYVPDPKSDAAAEMPPSPDVVDQDVPTFPDREQPDAAPPDDAAPDVAPEATVEDIAPPPDAAPDASPDAAPDVAADGPCRTRCAGFCVDPDTDPENCGACGNDCTLRPGVDISRVRCVMGRCDFTGACLAGRANCSGNPDDGCEATVNTAARCGSCTNACRDPAPTCAAMPTAPGGYACSSGCPVAGQQRCGGVCIDTTSDPRNCGACGTVCPAVGGAPASCVMGRCSFTCPVNTGDCDGNTANGCETNLRSSAMHCGMCGNACTAPAGSTAFCSLGVCTLTCTAGNGNCDMNTANGCETDLRTSVMNCGSCGNACPSGPSGTSTCASGVCSVTCNPGYGNCNAVTSDGCEADFNTNPLHCGMCNRRCAAAANASAACAAGSCTIACLANYGNCDGNGLNGCETPLATDPMNCGACGMRCPSAPGAAATCRTGTCALACMTGQGDCDGMIANGCEVDLTRSSMHCGACGRACTAPTNGRVACEASACVITCDAGYQVSGTTCVRAPLRPVAPAGGTFVTTRRPTFRFTLAPGVTGGRVEVCGDRACTMVATTVMATGDSVTSPATLTPGVYFWRVTGTAAGSPVSPASPAAEFAVVAGAGAATSSSWGPFLDANGDRYADLLIGVPSGNRAQYHVGSTGSFSTAYTTLSGGVNFGAAVAAAGDVNGDGYGDAVVGSSTAGPVYVYHGGVSGLTGTVATTLVAPTGATRFGAAVTGAGDVNGDGYADVLVGAPGSSRAYLYLGGATGLATTPATTLTPTGAGTNFGGALAGAGDLNADGFADVAVGTDAGIVYVWFGGASGLGATPTGLSAPTGNTSFGHAVAGAGDVNGDGYPDLVVGAYTATAAYVFRGSSSGIATTPTSTITSSTSQFGLSVDGAGDVNGDGFGDVVVGAPGGEFAYIFHGSAAGAATTPSTTLTRTYAGYLFGTSTSGFGDYNLDGYSDVAVGAPGRVVQIYRGSASGATLYQNLAILYTTFGQAIASLFGLPVPRG